MLYVKKTPRPTCYCMHVKAERTPTPSGAVRRSAERRRDEIAPPRLAAAVTQLRSNCAARGGHAPPAVIGGDGKRRDYARTNPPPRRGGLLLRSGSARPLPAPPPREPWALGRAVSGARARTGRTPRAARRAA